jgi:hypothetical protein
MIRCTRRRSSAPRAAPFRLRGRSSRGGRLWGFFRALAALLLLLSTGCIGMPWRWGKQEPSHRQACKQALEQGWCYTDCRRQPLHCVPLVLVSCNDAGMCMFKAKDGSLVFGGLR